MSCTKLSGSHAPAWEPEKYIKPLSIPDGAALLHKTLKFYAPDKAITPANALYASAQVGGHPYYLFILLMTSLSCALLSLCMNRIWRGLIKLT
jgi:hypothetical protein